ncbi:autotransporter outer membrane beta-barrel domain-containing protein [Ignatzschineria sp. LJL83]
MSKFVPTLTGAKKRPLSHLNFGKILGVTSVLVSSNMFVQANETPLFIDSLSKVSQSAPNPAIPDLAFKIPIPKQFRNHQNGTFDFGLAGGNFGLAEELTDRADYVKEGGGTLYLMTEKHLLKKYRDPDNPHAPTRYALPDSINHQFKGTFTIKGGTVVSGGNESLGAGLYDIEKAHDLHAQLTKETDIRADGNGDLFIHHQGEVIRIYNNEIDDNKEELGGFTDDYTKFINDPNNGKFVNGKLEGDAIYEFPDGASYIVNAGAVLHLNGFDQTLKDLTNEGQLFLKRGLGGRSDKGEEKGSRLNIKGDYHGGTNSSIHFGVITADKYDKAENGKGLIQGDGSEFDPGATERKDLLVIHGKATGTSKVYVQGVIEKDGVDAEGVSLVYVLGEHDGFTLTQADRLTEGGVEYWLNSEMRDASEAHSDHDGKAKTWYLSKYKRPLVPLEPSKPIDPTDPPIPWTPLEPSKPIDPTDPTDPPIPWTPLEPSKPIDPTDPTDPPIPWTPLEPSKPIDPTDPTDPPIPWTPLEPSKPIDPDDNFPVDPPTKPLELIIAPEVAANLANLKVANEMFAIRYHDRQYLPGDSGFWIRTHGMFSDFGVKIDRDLNATVNAYTIHIGKDLLQWDKFNFGVMGAYGTSDGKSINHYTNFTTDHSSDGFAVGAYANYNFSEDSYIDSWVQYAHIRNKVHGWGLASEKYTSKGFLASIEAGHAFAVTENVRVQPQAQVTWMNVKADNYTTAGGTNVSANKGNVQTRLGVRVYNANATFAPYAGVHYLHNSKDYRVTFRGKQNEVDAIAGTKNLYQLEFGMATKDRLGWNADGSVTLTKGKDSYSDTRVKFDFRYEF